jgi:hypothetical protein
VTGAILIAFRDHLSVNSSFDPEAWLCREGFYRLVLTDRYRVDWREWAYGLIRPNGLLLDSANGVDLGPDALNQLI